MSTTTGILAGGSKSFLYERVRIFFMRHPEWWAWTLGLFAWVLLAFNHISASGDSNSRHPIIYCMPGTSAPAYGIQDNLKEENISASILTTIPNGLLPWMLMVVAMMFPLLKYPVRHVAFSVRKKDRAPCVFSFLTGYAILWTLIGVLFLFIPIFLERIVDNQSPFLSGFIIASVFLLAAIVSWLPARPGIMMKGYQTLPIRIDGWRMHLDSFRYGFKMGTTCLNMCWVAMAALMLAHHNIGLMYAVTIVLFYERYLLPHTSRLPGYAWTIIGLTLFSIEFWA